MLVCYGVARWSYGGDTVYAGRATVMPRNKPALFHTPVLLKNLKPPGSLPGERRFNTVYPDLMWCLPASLRCGPGGPPCPNRSAAGTENRDSVNEA